MKDPDTASVFLPLTQEVVRKYLSVTPAHRREHLHCFPGLTLEQAKDDDVFYPHLTGMLNDDPAAVSAFDREMVRRGKKDKAFLSRCFRRLFTDFGLSLSQEEGTPDLRVFADNPALPDAARQLVAFAIRCMDSAGTVWGRNLPAEGGDAAQGDAVQPDPAARWTEVMNQLRADLTAADEPDEALAERILSLGAELAGLARSHREALGAMEALEELKASLCQRIEDCFTPDELAAADLTGLPADRAGLERLGALMDAVEQAARDMAEAERERLTAKDAVQTALDNDDVDRVADLNLVLKQRLAQHEAARDLRSAKVAAARGMLVGGVAAVAAKPMVAAQVEAASHEDPPPGDDPVVEAVSEEADLPPEAMDEPAEEAAAPETPEPQAAPEPDAELTEEASPEPSEAAWSASLAEEPVLSEPAVSPATAAADPDDPEETDEVWDDPGTEGPAPTAFAPETEAEWTGGKDIDALIEDYLRRRETVFAATLTELAEARGVEVPFPAQILQALHESRLAIRPDEIVSPRLTGALDRAVSARTELESGPDVDLARL